MTDDAAIKAPQVEGKSKITARQLLSLSSGLSADFPPRTDLTVPNTYRASIFNLSATAPGEAVIYSPSTFQAFGVYFELKSGGRLTADYSVTGGKAILNYQQARLFTSIGRQVGVWSSDASGRATLPQGAFLTSREWLNFGQSLLQGGKWEGKTILSESRLRECSTFNNAAFAGYGLALWSNRPVGDTYTAGVDGLPTNAVNLIN